jgi:hypothetical protein
MDFCRLLQLIHAEGMRTGNRYQWKNFFEPEQELIDEFDRLATKELPEL